MLGLGFIVILIIIIVVFIIVKSLVGNYASKLQVVTQQDPSYSYWSGLAQERYNGLILGGQSNCAVQHALLRTNGVSMGDASYALPAGDSREVVPFSFVAAQLQSTSAPHAIIDSRANNTLGRSICDAIQPGRYLEVLTLEGDFPSSYKVYVEQGKEQELLVMLNPSAMSRLVNELTEYDIEVVGNQLYLYYQFAFDLDKPATLEKRQRDIETAKSILNLV